MNTGQLITMGKIGIMVTLFSVVAFYSLSYPQLEEPNIIDSFMNQVETDINNGTDSYVDETIESVLENGK